MRHLLLVALAVLGACTSNPPVIVAAQVGVYGNTQAIARTNLRQTYVRGSVAFKAELMTTDGIPLMAADSAAGQQLYIDRDLDIRVELPIGEPVPASARVLFPRPGEAEALGITFQD